MDAVVTALRGSGAQRIADLGCGQGTLVRALLKETWVDRVVGVDVSWRSLETPAAGSGSTRCRPVSAPVSIWARARSRIATAGSATSTRSRWSR